MHEIQFAFSIALWAKCSLDYKAHGAFFYNELRTFIKAGLTACTRTLCPGSARPLSEIYCFIYLTSGFAGLVSICVLYTRKALIPWSTLFAKRRIPIVVWKEKKSGGGKLTFIS
jgi:hypothetical protein